MNANDNEIHLLDYWRILIKRRNVVLIFFAIVVGIVSVYSFSATPIYRGTAQILFDLEKNPLMNFVEGGGAYLQLKDSAEYYRTQIEILKSRAFADRVVRKLQLERNPYFLERKESGIRIWLKSFLSFITGMLPEKAKPSNPVVNVLMPDELDPYLTNEVLTNTSAELVKGSNILRISYDSKNSVVAAAMANGVAASYIEHNLDIRVKPFKDAVEWLSARTVDSRARVEESEKVLQQYKEGKGIVSFEMKENVITQKLQEITTQLVQAESKRQETEVRYNQIKSVIEKPELLATVPDIMNNLVIQGLRNQELDIKKQISELSDKFGPKHPQMIKARTELDTVRSSLIIEARKMLNAAKTDHDIAKGRENSLRKAIEDQKHEVLDFSRKAIEFGVFAGEAESNKQFYELLLKKMQEASLSSGITVSNAQIVDGATVPGFPIKPKRMLNFILSVIVGLLGGIFSALFIDYMDDTIKTSEDVEKALTLPFLGYVPSTDKEDGPIYMFSGSRASIAEAYRTIRTSIMLSSADDKVRKVLLVTSSTPHEGKTTTAANLAVAMAQMGERVLLIDTDMRRHNLHKVFTIDNLVGISDMIVDHANTTLGIKTLAHIPNLSIITGGTLAPNPSELLGSNSMRSLIAEFGERYDRVILDSPPLLAFSDSLVLSRLADGVVFVVWGEVTARDTIKKTTQSIMTMGGKILGIVLNNLTISSKSSYYYYPYYGHYYGGYGAEETDKKKTEKKKA